MLFVLLVRAGLWMGLTRARELIIDSAPILSQVNCQVSLHINFRDV